MNPQIAASIAARGEDAILSRAGGDSRTVRGIYTRVLNSETVGDAEGLRARTTFVVTGGTDAEIKDELNIRGARYVVRDIEGNPAAALTLVLRSKRE